MAAVKSQLRAFIFPPSPRAALVAGGERAECSVDTIARNMARRARSPRASRGGVAGSGGGRRPRCGRDAAPGREKVLKQVRVPHHYYYREMYLPQADERPELARLVARRTGAGRTRCRARSGASELGVAASPRQLTDGPGYDYQPDWSPDGRLLVYASYHDDAVELRLLDLASGGSWPLTDERRGQRRAALVARRDDGWRSSRPRSRGASTCSSLERADGAAGRASAPHRGRATAACRATTTARFDQYLSPTWSPDGKRARLRLEPRPHLGHAAASGA